MAANINPTFSRASDAQIGTAVGGANLTTTAVTATDGSGALPCIYQADTTEGSWVEGITLKAIGSPAATVLRVFLCSVTDAYTAGSSNSSTNTALIAEIATAAFTASNTAASPEYYLPIRRPIPAGYRLLLGSGTSTGASGNSFAAITWAGKY